MSEAGNKNLAADGAENKRQAPVWVWGFSRRTTESHLECCGGSSRSGGRGRTGGVDF